MYQITSLDANQPVFVLYIFKKSFLIHIQYYDMDNPNNMMAYTMEALTTYSQWQERPHYCFTGLISTGLCKKDATQVR